MLTTILVIVLLIIGIILIVIGEVLWYDGVIYTGITFTTLPGFALIFVIAFICKAQIPKQKNYEIMLYEKEVLEYRLTHKEENEIGNELLYREIVDFNNALKTEKYYSNIIWTNWFCNDLIASIGYIEIAVKR